MYKNIFAYIFCVKKIEVVTKMIKILRNPDLDERKKPVLAKLCTVKEDFFQLQYNTAVLRIRFTLPDLNP